MVDRQNAVNQQPPCAAKGATLALDLGTTTGWAFGVPGNVMSGSVSFKNDRYSGGGMRYLRFERWLTEMHTTRPIREVVFEEVRNHKGVDAAHVYGGLMATLTKWCESQDPKVPYEGVPVGQIKRFATGKGNAKKDAIIAAVESWGYHPADDNEADSLALLHLRMTGDPANAIIGPKLGALLATVAAVALLPVVMS